MEKSFNVPEKDIKRIKKVKIKCGEEYKYLFVCPYCYVAHGEYRNGNVAETKEEILEHMKTKCSKNPQKIIYVNKNQREYERLINDDSKHEIEPKFLMASGFYHKAYSDPESIFFDLCRVSEETNEAYIGAFVFGIGMFDVVFPKKFTRELNKEEIEKYNGKNIAINNNPPHAKLNILENKMDSPYQIK